MGWNGVYPITLKNTGGRGMTEKKTRRMMAKMVVIVTVFVMGLGVNVANAGYLFESTVNAMLAGEYQGLSQARSALALYYNSSSYLYNASVYMDNAEAYADDAWYYAYLSSRPYAYYAELYADKGYYYLDLANKYAYYAYIYSNEKYTQLALYYGGYGAYYMSIAEAYAGIGSDGGTY
jgi:hypothetical protein